LFALKSSFKAKPKIKKILLKDISSLKDEQLADTLQEALKESRLSPFPLIICLPRNQVMVKTLRFPSVEPSQIDKMLSLHVGRQVSYPKEEIVYGYKVIGVDEIGYTKILLAIVHRNIPKRILNILFKLNLFPEEIELSSDGILNWLLLTVEASSRSEEPYLILDVDYEFTDFLVILKDKPLFTLCVSQGAEQLSDKKMWAKFIGEIKQSLVIFKNEAENKKLSRVYLSGAVLKGLEGLDLLLSQELGLPVEIIPTFKNISIFEQLKLEYLNLSPGLSITGIVGLGIESQRKTLNFNLPELEIKKEMKKKIKQLVILGSFFIYVFIVIGAIFIGRLYNRRLYLRTLKEYLNQKGKGFEELLDMSKRVDIVSRRLDASGSALTYLYELHRLIPKEIALSAITFEEEDRLLLRGQSPEMSDIFNFISTLEASKHFTGIQTQYTRKKKVKGREISEFEIICRLKR
jgi:Tfp pilus assembly PilM family ATPase